MKPQKRFTLLPGLLAVLSALSLIAACAPTATPTLFIAPRAATVTAPPVQGETPVIPTLTPSPVVTSSPTATPPCTDDLAFVQDVTVPDGTVVAPGASIDKQWLVQNSGTCNWDSRYRLKFAGGNEMGAAAEQALYPARAGGQVTIRMAFTAPSQPGEYTTAWQAINPDGEPFGESIFVKIDVQVQAEVTLEIIDGGGQQ